jgi:hypothetical protein
MLLILVGHSVLAHCSGVFNQGARIGARVYGSNEGGAEVIETVKQVVHPDYNPSTIENDFRLIQLANFSTKIPAKWNRQDELPASNQALEVIGFGLESERDWKESQYLMQATVNEIPIPQCMQMYPKWIYPEDMFCAGIIAGGER